MSTLKVFLALALMFVLCSANAQERAWHIAFTTGDTLKECKLLGLNDSVLIVDRGDTTMSVPVDSVVSLFRHKERLFMKGAPYGAVAGIVVGAVIGVATYEKPYHAPTPPEPGLKWDIKPPGLGLDADDFFGGIASLIEGAAIGGVVGFAIGGALSAAGSGDELYELSKIPHRAKLMILQKIMPEKE